MRGYIYFWVTYWAMTSVVTAETMVYFGSNDITASMTGLSESHPSVYGSSLGQNITFDLMLSARNVGGSSLALSHHPDGIGIIGGSYQEIDNRNNLDPNDDESMTFDLTNIQGLADGQSLRISAIGTRSLGNQTKEYRVTDASGTVTGSFNTSPIFIRVPNLSSVTLTAIGPATGTPANSRFIINRLELTLISESDESNDSTGDNASAATVADVGINGSGHPYVNFETESGYSYEVYSVNELSGSSDWIARVTLSGSGESVIYTDESMDPTVQAQGFYRIETVQTPQGNLNNTTLSIEQTWSQEPNGFERTADVIVPVGSGPHPVVIMLHGNGGDSGFIQSMGTTLNNAIRVAPNGYLKSWNVDNEASKAPDVAFIRELINLLRSYDNVDAGRISIFGSSNGSGMTNRLLIELDGAAFQRGAGRVSQMITKMYHDGSFWYNSNGDNSYNEPIVPASGRRILMISGDSDPLIPYTGGNGVGTTFMDAQESIYRLAQAMGETGTQINDADGVAGNLNDANPNNDFSAAFIRYSYLGGQVVHFKLIGGDHGLDVGGSPGFSSEANQMIADFLLE